VIILKTGFEMITITVSNQKGGVGKTTIAFNIAHILATNKRTRVLAIDNDPQGNLTASFIKKPSDLKGTIINSYEGKLLKPEKISNNLYLLGSDITLASAAERDFQIIFKLKESIERLKTSAGFITPDYIIIDSLPSFGHLHLAALCAADYVLIPVKPAPYAFSGMKDLFTTIEKSRKYFNPNIKILGIVINQVDGRRLIMEREMEESLREIYGELVLKSRIKKKIRIEESPAFRKSIAEYDPESPATSEFRKLVKEIRMRMKHDQ
jgi:chromosome partitioning protein